MRKVLLIFFGFVGVIYFGFNYMACANYDLLYSRCDNEKGKYKQIESEKRLFMYSVIFNDQKIKKKLMIDKGATKEETEEMINSLDSKYEKEKEKFYQYCNNEKSENCKIIYKTQIDSEYRCDGAWRLIFDNPEVVLKYVVIVYMFDKESLAFLSFDKETMSFFNFGGYSNGKYLGIESTATYINCSSSRKKGYTQYIQMNKKEGWFTDGLEKQLKIPNTVHSFYPN